MAEPVAPIVLRCPSAADPAVRRAAPTVLERVAAWFANPRVSLGAPRALDFDDGMVVDVLAGEA